LWELSFTAGGGRLVSNALLWIALCCIIWFWIHYLTPQASPCIISNVPEKESLEKIDDEDEEDNDQDHDNDYHEHDEQNDDDDDDGRQFA
jgi:hypothetical protein